MSLRHIISTINKELISAFALLDRSFDDDKEFLHFKSGGWSAAQILEHVTLTNHYLLILISRASEKVVRRAKTIEITHDMFDNYSLTSTEMENIGLPLSFAWESPDHMIPRGEESLSQLRLKLRLQLGECLETLDRLKNGEGILCKTTMSVNGLGKLDVYQYLYFLALHVKRHVVQIEKLYQEFDNALEM